MITCTVFLRFLKNEAQKRYVGAVFFLFSPKCHHGKNAFQIMLKGLTLSSCAESNAMVNSS